MYAVVGGGIAGLAAAYRLQASGEDVRVFEASDDVGGLAATYQTGGDRIEKFYHHLSAGDETIVELATDLGLDDHVEWRYKTDAFYVDGVVHPMERAWEIAAYPHLSLYDKFRLAMLVLEVDVTGGIPRLNAFDDITAYENITAVDFLRKHTTERVFEHFWTPLLSAKFGDRMKDVSAAWLLGRIRFRGERHPIWGERLGYFNGGFHRLIDRLVDAVGTNQITTGTRVTDLKHADGAVTSITVETEQGTKSHDVEGVIVATMPDVLESLTGYQCAIDFQATVCSVWSMDRSLTDAYWINLVDEAPFGVFIEHTNFIPESRYNGEHLYYTASYIQNLEDDLWTMSDEEVESRWSDGIQDLFTSFDRTGVNWVRTARHPRTAPVYETGYLEDVIPYDLSTAIADGIYYAGMASRSQYPERSLNGGIEAGFSAADAAVEASGD